MTDDDKIRRIDKKVIAALFCAVIVAVASAFAWFAVTSTKDLPTVNASLPTLASYFDGGTGTVGNPFKIRTKEQLNNLAWLQYMGYFNRDYDKDNKEDNFYFKLTANINMKDWTIVPIGTEQYPFIGNFNGNSKTISNLTVTNSSEFTAYYNAPYTLSKTTGNTVSGVNAIGFFGVVGLKEGSTDHVTNTSLIGIKNFTLKSTTVDVKTSTAIAGIAVGYLNAPATGVVVDDSTASNIKTSQATAAYDADLTENISDYFTVGYATKDYKTEGTDNEVVIDKPVFESTKPDDDGWDTSAAGTSWGNSMSMNAFYTRLNMYYNTGWTVDSKVLGKGSAFKHLVGAKYYYESDGKTLIKSDLSEATEVSESPTSNIMHVKAEDKLKTSAAITEHNVSLVEWFVDIFGFNSPDSYYLYGENTFTSNNYSNTAYTKIPEGSFHIRYYIGDRGYYLAKLSSSVGISSNKNGYSPGDKNCWVFSDAKNRRGDIYTTFHNNASGTTKYYLYTYNNGDGVQRIGITTDKSKIANLQWWEDAEGNIYADYWGNTYVMYLENHSSGYEYSTNWKLKKLNSDYIYINDGKGNYLNYNYYDEDYEEDFVSVGSSAASKIKVIPASGDYVKLQFVADSMYLTVTSSALDKSSETRYDSDSLHYMWKQENGFYVNNYNDKTYYLFFDGTKWTISSHNPNECFRICTEYNGKTVYMEADDSLGLSGGDIYGRTEGTYSEQILWKWDGSNLKNLDGNYLGTRNGELRIRSNSSNAKTCELSGDKLKVDGQYVYYDGEDWLLTSDASKAGKIVKDEIVLESKSEYCATSGVAQHIGSEYSSKADKTYKTPDTYIPLLVNSSYPSPSDNNPGYLLGGAYNDQSNDKVVNSGDVLISGSCYTFKNLTYSNNGSTVYSGKNLEVLTRNQNSGGKFVRIKDAYNTEFTNSKLSGYDQKTVAQLQLKRYETARANLHNTLLNGNKDTNGATFINGVHFYNCKAGIASDCAGIATLEEASILGETHKGYQMLRDSFDLNVKEKGYINLFASSFLKKTSKFFTVYKITRNSNNRIKAVEEINTIYEVPKTDSTEAYYVYNYVGSSNYYKADGDTVSLPSNAELVFSKAWLDGSDIENSTGILGARKDGALYYFEIPVDEGEYAIGGSGSGASAMIMYMDIGASPIDISNRTETNKVVENDFGYPTGVYLRNSSSSANVTDACVSIAETEGTSNTVSVVKSGSTVTASGSDIAAAFINNGITMKDGSGNALEYETTETITRTITSTTENYETNTFTETVVTIVQVDGEKPTTATLKTVSGTLNNGTRTITSTTEEETIEYEVDSEDGKLSIEEIILKFKYKATGEVTRTIEYKDGNKYEITLDPDTGVSELKISTVVDDFNTSTINGTVMTKN